MQEDFINEEENLKLNQCRKRKSMELFCHKSRDRRGMRWSSRL